MNNLNAIIFIEQSLRPVGASNDMAVEFNRQAFGCECEMLDEFRHSAVHGQFERFAVHFDNQSFLNLSCLQA
jgi:hypothetical protein